MALNQQPNDEEKQEKLANDFDPPFSPPADVPRQGRVPSNHPVLDTDTDEDEWYDEGRSSAAGTDRPAPPRAG
ncbi:MAG TPA: hypothetical protein VJ836_04305 [Candidatus Saccharimonadales bacterium]|nr:hypothetical protein [Candidatus Saccharimonadales bacterium]